MRLALIGPSQPYRGGISQYNTQLYRRFQGQHEVILINFRRQYPSLFFPGKMQFSGPEESLLGEPLIDSVNPWTWHRPGRRLARFRPDAAVFHWWHPFFGLSYRPILAQLGKLQTPCRRLFLCHNVYPHERAPGALGRALETRFIRSVFSRVDGFLTQSQAMVGQIRDLGCAVPIRKVFHPCYEHFGGSAEPARPAPDETLRMLFFGNIRLYKGLDVLIDALGRLPADLAWKLRVAGEFYQAQELIERAAELGIAEHIQWENRYVPDSEVGEHFRWAQVLVAPYRKATQSGVIPLAYQFGLPVITTTAGGLPEIVREGETGLLVPPGDAAQLADAIRRFYDLRQRVPWSGNVKQLARLLSWEQVEDAILSLAEEPLKLG